SALGDNVTPGGDTWWRASTDEGQDRFHNHCGGADVSGLNDQRRERVREHVAKDDQRGAGACGNGTVNKRLFSQRQDDATYKPRHTRHFRDGYREYDIAN